MITMTESDYINKLKEQGHETVLQAEFVCPRCGKVQTGQDLIDAGAGKTLDEIQGYLAYSCVGRWDESKGCDWTLGGLFQIHQLEVTTDEGHKIPQFRPVNIPAEESA